MTVVKREDIMIGKQFNVALFPDPHTTRVERRRNPAYLVGCVSDGVTHPSFMGGALRLRLTATRFRILVIP